MARPDEARCASRPLARLPLPSFDDLAVPSAFMRSPVTRGGPDDPSASVESLYRPGRWGHIQLAC